MSWRLMDQVLLLALPAEQEQVLMRLAQRASDDGTHCYPSVDELARSTGRGERAVQRALRALKAEGHISPLAYEKGGRGHATEWLVCPQLKSVTDDTLIKEERVSPVVETVSPMTERVSPVTEKGVTGDTPVDQEKISEKIRKRSGGGAKRAPREYEPVDDEFLEALRLEYEPIFGPQLFALKVKKCCGLAEQKHYKDRRTYLAEWLASDAARMTTNGRANGHASSALSAAAERFRGVDTPFGATP